MPSSPSPLALGEECMDVSGIIANMNANMDNQAEESGDTDHDNSGQFPDPHERNINGLIVRFPGIPNLHQHRILTDLTFNLQHKINGLIECPQERDRRQAELAAFLAVCCEGREIRYYRNRAEAQLVPDPDIRGPSPTAKLLFVTKTFQEIDQVISDLQMFKKTGYLEHITLNILGHHSQICGQSCSGSNPGDIDFSFINQSNATIHTISKLRGAAQRKRFCAYQFCKERVNSCNILVCPQDIILSPFWRNFFNINLDQALIIFDDGGNIETVLADQGSISIPTFMLKQAGNNLQAFANSVSQHVPEHFQLIEEIRGLSSLLITFANKIESDYYSALEGKPNDLERLREVGLGQNEVNLRLGQFQRFFVMSHDLKTGVKLEEKTVANVSKFLSILGQLFDHQTDNASDLEFTTHLTDFQQAVRFNIICNKPSIFLEPLEKATIVISSGCLPSIEVLCHELSTFTEKTVIEEQSVTNCFIAYVSGSNGVKLGFSEKDLSRSIVQLEAGDTVLEMCKPVEGGTVVCFSSRKQLGIITKCWEDTNNREKSILDEIKETKNFYSEHGLTDEGDCKRNLEKFLENCKKPVGQRNGAILFALHRGKMLENLQGQGQVKLFISCGVPYSSMRDFKVIDKKEYYKAVLTEEESQKWSPLHYNADMFHILMQNVARSVKNGEEKIAYVILDSRMEGKAKDFEIFLPAWIRKEVKGFEDCKEMVKALNDFMG